MQAITAANNEVKPPIIAMVSKPPGREYAKIGNNLATKNTPATTMVAACINAETGVGPSIASGNQICKGNMADFPAPHIKISRSPHVITDRPINEVEAQLAIALPYGSVRVAKSNDPP